MLRLEISRSINLSLDLPVKSYIHIFRTLHRILPLFIAVLLVASQTLAALHYVAHANTKSVAASSGFGAGETSVDARLASPPIWTALFGHATDDTENNSACLAWDAVFASAAQPGDASSIPATVFYSVAAPLAVSVQLDTTDFLGFALARAPPRA